MGRIAYYHQDGSPAANWLVPGGSAIVVDERGHILLQRRRDNSRWALPGGVMEIGEDIGRTAAREVEEETGIEGGQKSTRLNSSHSQNSYAVFCLKKKKNRRPPLDKPVPPDATAHRPPP